MKRRLGILGAVSMVALAMPVLSVAKDKAALESIHARAEQADTAAKHASVARDYRLQAEAFGKLAAGHEREAAQLARASGAIIHKWPAMASRQLQQEKAKAVEARRAERESMALADRHIRLAVEAQAEGAIVAGQ